VDRNSEVPATIGKKPPTKRPNPLPAELRKMIRIVVRGDPDTGEVVDFFAAARMAGVQAQRARRWNDRTEFRQAVQAEHKLFLREMSAGNGLVLKGVRDTSRNPMARLKAIELIEAMSADPAARQPADAESRFTINIVNRLDRPPVTIVEGVAVDTAHRFPAREPVPLAPMPEPLPEIVPELQPDPEDLSPIFCPRRW
jgi:hypothetical protein